MEWYLCWRYSALSNAYWAEILLTAEEKRKLQKRGDYSGWRKKFANADRLCLLRAIQHGNKITYFQPLPVHFLGAIGSALWHVKA